MARGSFTDAKALNKGLIVLGLSLGGDVITTDGYGAGFTYTRTSTGVYTITLAQRFRELMSVTASLAQTTPTALTASIGFPVGGSDGKTITVNVVNTSNTATNIAFNDRINVNIIARNTADGVNN